MSGAYSRQDKNACVKIEQDRPAKRRKIDYGIIEGSPADMTVICRDVEFHVEKVRMSKASLVIGRLCDTVAENQIVEIEDEDPHVVQAAIYFIHEGWYDDNGGNDPARPSDIVFNAQMYGIGAKWSMEALQQKSIQYFCEAADDRWNTDAFFEAVKIMYENASDSDHRLREKAAQYFAENLRWFLRESPKFKAAMTETKGLGVDVATALNNVYKQYKCPNCKTTFDMGSLEEGEVRACIYCAKKVIKPNCASEDDENSD